MGLRELDALLRRDRQSARQIVVIQVVQHMKWSTVRGKTLGRIVSTVDTYTDGLLMYCIVHNVHRHMLFYTFMHSQSDARAGIVMISRGAHCPQLSVQSPKRACTWPAWQHEATSTRFSPHSFMPRLADISLPALCRRLEEAEAAPPLYQAASITAQDKLSAAVSGTSGTYQVPYLTNKVAADRWGG